jgi:phosphomannomutase
MALKFGTSGVRGLVTEMTDLECYLYSKAYSQYLKETGADTVCIAGDFRNSTPRIINAVAFGIREAGLSIDNVGFVPTPTLAVDSMAKKAGGIMVTGSHIPDDRNGIKFYMPEGEILKSDEEQISAIYAKLKTEAVSNDFDSDGMLKAEVDAGNVLEEVKTNYINRYTEFFPENCLEGLKLVFYQHSTVGRTIMPEIFEKLGANVHLVGWSDSFVPVDTEAVSNPEELAAWVKEYSADALFSADGDCDRPLLVDETGDVIGGDLLGILAATYLKADSVSTPVSCNTGLELSNRFSNIARTKIGSPYVIAAMNDAVQAGNSCVMGYEANGGFLTGTDIQVEGCFGTLTALPTRDAVLPILSALLAAKSANKTLSELKNELPPRYTSSGIIREFPNEIGKAIVQSLSEKGIDYVNELLSEKFGTCEKIDITDGARMTFADGGVLHLRPSGNAPEFRIYTEYSTEEEAIEKNLTGRTFIAEEVKPKFS